MAVKNPKPIRRTKVKIAEAKETRKSKEQSPIEAKDETQDYPQITSPSSNTRQRDRQR